MNISDGRLTVTLGARDVSSAVSGSVKSLQCTAEDVSAFGQHRKFPPRARKTSGLVPRVVNGKIIFQKFQSKLEDYVLRYSFSHWGWKKTNRIALTICLFLVSSLAVYIFAPFIDKQCNGVGGHTFRFLRSNIHPTPCDVTPS